MEKIITRAQVKENNGGGLQIEVYDQDDNTMYVIAGMEYDSKADGYADLKGIVDGDWNYSDASQWYNNDDNSMGDKDQDGKILTASDVINDHESTKIIAEYNGKKMTIWLDDMGHAGQKYFSPKSN